jgi:DNA-binding CsgD family transcriptional regulator
MVGRTGELRRLQALTSELDEPRVVLISGEAGVGKSRLVREFVQTVEAIPVFVGRAEPGPVGRPFHVVQSALESAVADWTEVPPELAARSDALRVLLEPVAPGLGTSAAPNAAVVGEESLRSAVDLVRHLLDGRPGVLVAEDLHWADAESLLLVGRLATTPDLRLLVVGTFRPALAEGRRLAEMLDRVARQRMVEQIELRPLNEGQVAEWLASVYRVPIPRRVASDLARRTAGNPFFLEELVRSAPTRSIDELCALPLPASVSEAVLRHVEGLDATQRRIVDAAAVLGRRIAFDLLAVVCGAGEDELIETMRELVDRGLVLETEPDVFTFRHALTREAVAQRLLGRQRRRLHEKAHGALLEMGSDDWGALAYHAAGAHLWDDVIDAARCGAAVHLRTGSTYEALRLAELGLQEAEADAELLELATRAAWACGMTDSALSYAKQWSALAEASADDAELSRALRSLSRLYWESDDRPARDQVIARLLVLVERLPAGPEVAAIYSHVAEVRMLAARSAEAVEWADRAIELIARIDDDEALPAALVNKGSALFDMPGHWDEGAALLKRAIEVSESRGDVHSALRAVNNLLHGVLVRWPVDDVWALLEDGRSLAERWGRHDWASSRADITAAFYSEAVGDISAAREVLDEALADPLAEHSARRPWLLAERAWVALELGEEGLPAILDRVRALSTLKVSESGLRQPWLESLEIEVATRAADVPAVSRVLDQIALSARMHEGDCTLYSWTWGVGLLAAVRAGVDTEHVRSVLQQVFASPVRVVRDEDEGWRLHVEGAIAEVLGDHARAIEHLLQALAEPRRRPGKTVEADAQIGLARCYLAVGDLESARVHVDEAGRLLSKWRGWRCDEVEALRQRLSTGGTRVSTGQLTARERDVAALVAQGMSNGEIGRKLFISTKTASVHVSNILAKLHMTSRAQIAVWAVAEGLS